MVHRTSVGTVYKSLRLLFRNHKSTITKFIYKLHHMTPVGIVHVVVKSVDVVRHKSDLAVVNVNLGYHVKVDMVHGTVVVGKLQEMSHSLIT